MIYEHQCGHCKHEWEDEYGMKEPVPTKCPKCKKKGKVKRLISSGISGKVPLTGREMIAQTKIDARKEAKEMRTNENKFANFVGESNFNEWTTRK